MGLRRTAVTYFLRGILNVICKIDTKQLYETLSNTAPMFVIFNHVNFLDAPILVTQCYPLKMTGLAKKETWDNPVIVFIFSSFNAVSIDRRGAFIKAFKEVRKVLDEGNFMCIAPEGTRSKNGVLQKGKAGILQLAIETNAPIIPVAHCGSEDIWKNLKRFKRTPVHFRAGRPFRLNLGRKPKRCEREQIVTEIMSQIARLLPQDKRGYYADQAEKECKYLEYLP